MGGAARFRRGASWAGAAALALSLVLVSCGGGDDDDGGDAAGDDGAEESTTTTLAPAPEESAWISTGAGLVRVDAAEGTPDEPIAYPGDASGALLATRDGEVWALVDRSLWRVDAVGGELSDEVPVEGADVSDAEALVVSDGSAWVALGERGLARIDLESGRAEAVDIGGEAEEVAVAGDGGVWVVRVVPATSRDLLRIDPDTGSPGPPVDVGVDFLDRHASGDRLWFGSSFVGGADGFVDVASSQPNVFDRSQVYGLAVGSEAVWYALTSGLVQVAPEGPTVANNVSTGALGGYPTCCGEMIAADGQGGIWVLLQESSGIGVQANRLVRVEESDRSAGFPVDLEEFGGGQSIVFG